MEKRRVVITGLGTVNPLGNNTADSWAAARAGKCGIGPITQFDTSEFISNKHCQRYPFSERTHNRPLYLCCQKKRG